MQNGKGWSRSPSDHPACLKSFLLRFHFQHQDGLSSPYGSSSVESFTVPIRRSINASAGTPSETSCHRSEVRVPAAILPPKSEIGAEAIAVVLHADQVDAQVVFFVTFNGFAVGNP